MMKKTTKEIMNIPKCHRCGADLVQIKLSEDSEVGWYCVGCDSDLIGETEDATTKMDD
jgi:transposase-like protein